MQKNERLDKNSMLLDAPSSSSIQTHRLGKLLGADFVAAVTSATCISPIITILDRALVEKSAYNQSLRYGMKEHSIDALKSPLRFALGRPFVLVWALYAATYTVSNTSVTLTRLFDKALVGTVTFINTTLVNVPLGIWKDVRFAQMFSVPTASPTARTTPTPAPAVTATVVRKGLPKLASATFLIRDCITIAGSFTMAPALAGMVPDSLSSNPHTKAMISQLTVPVVSQFFATPVHLLGLDQYARAHGISWTERAERVRRDLFTATIMRSLRIIPAFGVGGIVNMETRQYLHRNIPS